MKLSLWFELSIALTFSLALAATAQAAPKVAVLAPSIDPGASLELKSRFHEAILRGIGSSPGAEVVPLAEMRKRLDPSELAICTRGVDSCASQIAASLQIGQLVASEVKVNGKDYSLKLTLHDAAGRELAKVEDSCEICRLKEAEEIAARAAAKLLARSALPPERAPSPRSPLPSPPPPAVPTPSMEPVRADPASTIVPATAPSPQSVIPNVSTAARQPPYFRRTAIASLVLGLATLGAGIPLFIIDGQPTCNRPDPLNSCPDLYNTGGGGTALIAIGGAGLVSAGILFYLDRRQAHRYSLRATSGSVAPAASLGGW